MCAGVLVRSYSAAFGTLAQPPDPLGRFSSDGGCGFLCSSFRRCVSPSTAVQQSRRAVNSCPQLLAKSIPSNFMPKAKFFQDVLRLDMSGIGDMLLRYPQVGLLLLLLSSLLSWFCGRGGDGDGAFVVVWWW